MYKDKSKSDNQHYHVKSMNSKNIAEMNRYHAKECGNKSKKG